MWKKFQYWNLIKNKKNSYRKGFFRSLATKYEAMWSLGNFLIWKVFNVWFGAQMSAHAENWCRFQHPILPIIICQQIFSWLRFVLEEILNVWSVFWRTIWIKKLTFSFEVLFLRYASFSLKSDLTRACLQLYFTKIVFTCVALCLFLFWWGSLKC